MGDNEVDLWATDEVHFQQHGSRCRMWVPPETKDPVLLHHPTRRSVGYFGAVRLRDGKFGFSRETGKFNALTFLKRLRRTSIPAGRRVVVITDNAKYHHARLHKEWRENHAEDFALEYLPPYSPERNPIERVWKLTRRQCIHNRYFPRWRKSSRPSKHSLDFGPAETKPCVVYAQLLKTLCLALIGWTMLPAFRGQVLPQLPGRIGRPHYALAAAHASLGSIVEFAGLYILLAAGTKILPEKLRIKRYRLWMRSVLAAWWVVLFLGIVTYARWEGRLP